MKEWIHNSLRDPWQVAGVLFFMTTFLKVESAQS